jgi:hypothetical protein
MRSILLAITFFAINSWAGLEVQHCSSGDSNNAIRLCIDLTRQMGRLDINAEKVVLQFSVETKLISEFVLPSTGQSGTVEVFGEEASLKMAEDSLIHLACEIPKPGYCK